MKPAVIICVAGFCLLLLSCTKGDTWSGFFYPDKNDLTVDQPLGNFSSLQECREAAILKMQSTQNDNADYECGLNCNLNGDKPYICEKTKK